MMLARTLRYRSSSRGSALVAGRIEWSEEGEIHVRMQPQPAALTLIVVLGVGVVLLTSASRAAADLVRDGDPPPAADVREVFELVKLAWEREDPQALAGLVHEDGVRVTTPASGKGQVSYSPRQSYYFFKNLFRTNGTESFVYQRQQQATGPRVHAMAVWHCRDAAGKPSGERRLVLVLARSADGWLLAEINAVR